MTRFEVPFQEVLNDYPEIVEEFMNNLRNSNSQYRNIDLDNIRWYYTWEFCYDDVDENSNEESERFELKYEDRFQYELGKVKVSVTMKADQFKRRDRVNTSVLPSAVISIVDEVVKIMMIEEQKFLANEEVLDSIPPLNSNIAKMDSGFNFYQSYANIADDYHDEDEDGDIEYDLDTILDKINNNGKESLTKGELNFLDERSKNI